MDADLKSALVESRHAIAAVIAALDHGDYEGARAGLVQLGEAFREMVEDDAPTCECDCVSQSAHDAAMEMARNRK